MQISANTDKQMGVLSALRDLLHPQGVSGRLIRHVTLRMQGFPVWENQGAELEIYGLGHEIAVVTIDKGRSGTRFLIKLPKSGTVVPLSDVNQPQSAVRWISGWAKGTSS